jgi:hypothetical protein
MNAVVGCMAVVGHDVQGSTVVTGRNAVTGVVVNKGRKATCGAKPTVCGAHVWHAGAATARGA